MKTPEEIKKGLECCLEEHACTRCPYDDCDEGWHCVVDRNTDALAYIQRLEDHIRDLTKMVPKWISAEERLPENGDVVLVLASGKPRPNVTLVNAYLIASYWKDEGWIADGFEGWEPVDVTWWIPLPDEPKGVKSGATD